jgi:hypothetical protein
MSIRVNLPDGSVANFPEGMDPQQIQSEIEQHLTQAQQPAGDTRQRRQGRPAIAKRQDPQQPVQMPLNAMEQMYQDEAQRGGPPRRNADVQVRDQSRESLIQRALNDVRNTSGAIVGGMGAAVAPNPEREFLQSGGLAGDVAEVAKRVPGVVRGAARSAADLVNTVVNPYVEYATGYKFPTSSSIAEAATDQPQEQPQAQPQQTQGRQEQSAPQQATGPLPSAQNPNAGQRTDVSMPRALSIQGAREQGRGENAMSFSMGDGHTVQVRAAPPAAVRNGVKSGMDFLMERADQITLRMLQAGDVAGATEFRNFVRSEQAQKGMSYMNRAVIASTYGDSAAFTASLDRMVKSFDPDGDWQIDTKGTRLIQTDNGQAVGAMLSMRNKATGEVFEQEYMGMQNVIAALSDWGSPTAAYERQQERVAGAVSQTIANAKGYQEAFDKAMADMFDKGSFVDYDGNAISQEEMDRRVQMVNERIRMVRPDLIPQNAPRPGAASGVGAVMGGSAGQPVPTWGG